MIEEILTQLREIPPIEKGQVVRDAQKKMLLAWLIPDLMQELGCPVWGKRRQPSDSRAVSQVLL
jgi:hypothetical protein